MELTVGKQERKHRAGKIISLPLALGTGAAAIGAGYAITAKGRSFQKDPWTPIEKAMSASMTGLRKLFDKLPQQHRRSPQIHQAFSKMEEAMGELRAYAHEHRYTSPDARQPADIVR